MRRGRFHAARFGARGQRTVRAPLRIARTAGSRYPNGYARARPVRPLAASTEPLTVRHRRACIRTELPRTLPGLADLPVIFVSAYGGGATRGLQITDERMYSGGSWRRRFMGPTPPGHGERRLEPLRHARSKCNADPRVRRSRATACSRPGGTHRWCARRRSGVDRSRVSLRTPPTRT